MGILRLLRRIERVRELESGGRPPMSLARRFVGTDLPRMQCGWPFFILGNPRSGTTMLRLMMTCHRELSVSPECGFMLWLHKDFGDWRVDDCETTRCDDFVEALQTCRKFDTWDLESRFVVETIRERRPKDYSELVAAVHFTYAKCAGRTVLRWGDKNNFHIHRIEAIDRLYPSARFIHIVRDGRDVACSYRQLSHAKGTGPYVPNLPCEVTDIAAQWSAGVTEVAHRLHGLSQDRAITVRYEDLVRRPVVELRRLCRFVDVDFDDGMLEFGERNAKFGLEPTVLLGWKRRTVEPIGTSGVGKYRRLLSASELQQFTRIAGDALHRFGYTEGRTSSQAA